MPALEFCFLLVNLCLWGNPAEPSLMIDGILWEGFGGDPCDPCTTWCDAISMRMGYYGDFVFDRVLKTDVNKEFEMGEALAGASGNTTSTLSKLVERTNPAYGKHMQDAEKFTNAACMALNIWDRFDVFCTLGATSGYLRGNSASFNLVGLFGDGENATQPAATSIPNVQLKSVCGGTVYRYCFCLECWSSCSFVGNVDARL
uniref:Major outer membrane porin n=1 Tax=Chlamydia trachomatis TaxID=813 RepID=A0A346FTK2_CHLTH|nr:major outer membrane porin [Chlamydia trachomatis]